MIAQIIILIDISTDKNAAFGEGNC